MDKPKYKPEHMLIQAIGFTEEDLEANREGQISKRQRVRLKKEKSWWLGILTLVGVVACPLVSLVLFVYGFQSDGDLGSRLLLIGFVCILAAGFISYAEIKQRRFDNDLRGGTAQFVEGRAVINLSTQGKSGASFSVTVEDTTFNITKEIFLAFKNGDPYRIYYAPRSKTILSAEWLRDEG